MKKLNTLYLIIYLFGFFIFDNNVNFAQTPGFIWADNSTGSGNPTVIKTVTDFNGDIYSVGNFLYPSVSFGSFTLIQNGNASDIFVVKYNSDGDVIWAKSFGGTGYEEVTDCIVDYDGNLYIVGYFDSESLITGSTTLSPYFGFDMLVIKLDQNSNVLWSRNFGGDGDDYGLSCLREPNGNIVLTGMFSGEKMYFDQVLAKQNCLFTQFHAELESDADIVYAYTIAECYISGGGVSNYLRCFQRELDYKYYLLGKGDDGIFLHEYYSGVPSKDLLKIIASADGDVFATQGVVDQYGNVYISGYFTCDSMTVSGKGSSEFENLINLGGIDFFICKLSWDYKLLWAKSYGSNGTDVIDECVVGSNGMLYITGTFDGESIFSDNNIIINGSQAVKIFIVELSDNGNINWTRSNDQGLIYFPELALDNFFNIYVTGSYLGNCILGNISLDPAINYNANYFISKLEYSSLIDNSDIENSLHLFPNPNQGVLNINQLELDKYNTIEVISPIGQIICQFNNENISDGKIYLPLWIQNGTYILRLRYNNINVMDYKIVLYR